MTVKQKQCLLCYLGYYDGRPDGIWGDLSEQATMRFQTDYGLEADGIFGPKTEAMALGAVTGEAAPIPTEPEQPTEADDFWDSIQHFSREEFRCKCGGKYCSGFPVEPSRKLVQLADRVRAHFGAPAVVSSGIRCDVHNNKVGGVPNSCHKLGLAIDFTVRGQRASAVLAYVCAQPETRYAYAIDGSYVHMDVAEGGEGL